MTDISVYTLKPFAWSRNGISEEHVVPGDTFPLPEHLFYGLNKEGYVRRATIGDGHISLTGATTSPEVRSLDGIATGEETEGPGEEPAEEASEGTEDGAEVRTVSTKAPQPPARTAELTVDEEAALTDGSWRDWKFFKARSVAAKLSSQPIRDGKDATSAIEAELERRSAL